MVEWCAGYGGIHLGLKRAIPNLRVIAYGEIEAFACSNLVAKMEAGLLDAAPIWTDIKTFPCEAFRDRADILVAGYPCQPFSAAGKRLGTEDPRHLWPHIARAIRVIRPRMCFFENVEGHISLGLREVIGELESIGYQTAWGIFSAAEVGAPHQRKRVFILANLKCAGLERLYNWHTPSEQTEFVGADSRASGQRSAWPSRPGEPQHGWEPPRVVADGHRIDRSAPAEGREHDQQAGPAGEKPRQRQTQPPLGGDTHGTSDWLDYAELCVSCDNRTDELRLLGNGVVPATAERAFRVLIQQLDTPPQTQ